MAAMLDTAETPLAQKMGLRLCLMFALPCAVVGCSTPQPARITAVGTLPSGSGAGYVLTDGAVDEIWLSTAAMNRCLESKGMQTAPPPQYLVQYAVSVRPESSGLMIGKQAAEAAPEASPQGKKKGERIIYRLVVDRLSDSARVYEINVDAEYKARRSTATGRAAELCAAIGRKAG